MKVYQVRVIGHYFTSSQMIIFMILTIGFGHFSIEKEGEKGVDYKARCMKGRGGGSAGRVAVFLISNPLSLELFMMLRINP